MIANNTVTFANSNKNSFINEGNITCSPPIRNSDTMIIEECERDPFSKPNGDHLSKGKENTEMTVRIREKRRRSLRKSDIPSLSS